MFLLKNCCRNVLIKQIPVVSVSLKQYSKFETSFQRNKLMLYDLLVLLMTYKSKLHNEISNIGIIKGKGVFCDIF